MAHEDATWTTAFVNDLPDHAFLYVSPGGEKDQEGKTTPRSLRHFPYRGSDGKVDLPHLRNAIARIPQSDIPAAKKSELQAHAQNLLEKENKGDSRVDRVYRLDLSSGSIGDKRQTAQGGLIAKANLTRTGVFDYRMPDGSVRKELRHPGEVFHPDSLASYAYAPVTVDHPGVVGPHNWKDVSVGHVPEGAKADGKFVTGDLHVQDAHTIDSIERGKLREISCGYQCDLDPTPGTYQGKAYDAAQKNIRINHVALGPEGWGRMGPDVSLRMDAGAAISGPDGSAYVPSMAEADTSQELKAAKDEVAKLRADAKDTAAKVAELSETVRNLSAERDALKLQADKQRVDTASVEERARHDTKFEQALEEMIQLRSDARLVFATAEDPQGLKWDHKGKSPDAIRREVITAIEPRQPLSYDGTALEGSGLKAVYDSHIQRKRDSDKAREDAAKAASAEKKGEEEEYGDEEMDSAKARKAMVDRKKNDWKKKDGRRAAAKA